MRVFSLLILLVLSVAAVPEQRTDRVIVKPKPGMATKIALAHKKLGARVHRQFDRLGGLQVIQLPRGMTVEKALAHYRKLGFFQYVQPDYIRHVVATPDDPYFPGSLYGLINIGCTNAWDIRTNAEDVIVAVIDTGARLDHEDLVSNLWSNPCVNCPINGIVYSNDFHGINAITGDGDPTDDHGHGTHTAGTVGAAGNNTLGVCGVAWRVQLMPLKFIASNGSGSDADAVECIEYAIAKGAHIMSNSWGGYGDSPAIYDAIRHARDAGIIFVAAAGNDDNDNDAAPFIPAAFDLDNIVAVAATDSSDTRAYFSNYGHDTVDLGAPGVGIWSTTFNSTNSYGNKSGTSMATPHVAGAFALVKAEFPSETYTQLIHRILGTVDPVSTLSNITVTGGRLNVFNALTQTPKPLADFTSAQQGGFTVNFLNHTIGAVTNTAWDLGDGGLSSTFNSTHIYTNTGTYSVTLAVDGPGGSHSRTHSVTVGNNYYVRPVSYNWIDPTGMTPLTLTDDSTSSGQTLPFSFVYYGQTNTTLYVGSNGLLGFNSSNLASPAHTALPKVGTPNNLLAPYWADLNPSAAGTVYVGTTGTAPNQVEVVSWVGVPNFNDNSATLTFQVLLYETSNDIMFQYLEVQPTNTLYGASQGTTVGIEDTTGTIGRQISYNGTTLLTNNQAILFTLSPPAPVLTGIVPGAPATNLEVTVSGTTEPLASVTSCTGTSVVTTTADDTGAFTFPATVDTNSLTTFIVQATDTAGNVAPCSNSLTYRQLDPVTDTDGDGVNNLDELNAGTDPLLVTSYPHVVSITSSNVTIESVTNRTYQLQRCDDLISGSWTNIGTAVTGDGSLLSMPDADEVPKRFYRVKISP